MTRTNWIAWTLAFTLVAGTAWANIDGIWKDVPPDQQGGKYPSYLQTYTTGSALVVVLDTSGLHGAARFYVFLEDDYSDGVDADEIGGADAHLTIENFVGDAVASAELEISGRSESFTLYKSFEAPDTASETDNGIYKDEEAPAAGFLSLYLQTYYEHGSAVAVLTVDGGQSYYAFVGSDWSQGLDEDDLLGSGAHLTLSGFGAASAFAAGPASTGIQAASGTFALTPPGQAAITGSLFKRFQAPNPLFVRSSAFEDQGTIPVKYAAQGDGISPPLEWGNLPPGTQSLVLTMVDVDASNFVHWVVYDIPATETGLAEGAGTMLMLGANLTPFVLPEGAKEGANEVEQPAYFPPYPPPGVVHEYVFTLTAVGVPSLGLPAGASYGAVTDLATLGAFYRGSMQFSGMYSWSQ